MEQRICETAIGEAKGASTPNDTAPRLMAVLSQGWGLVWHLLITGGLLSLSGSRHASLCLDLSAFILGYNEGSGLVASISFKLLSIR